MFCFIIINELINRMKNYFMLFIAAFLFLQVENTSAQTLSPKDSVLKQMELANDYFMAKWPNPGAPIVHPDRSRPSNLWTRAAYYEGLMALYYTNKDEKLFNYAVDWGKSHDWEPTYGQRHTHDADHYCCGQTYVELFQISKDTSWILPIKETIDNVLERKEKSDPEWSWVDAIQMGMPLLAQLGQIYNDTAYWEKMYKMYTYSRNKHGENGLYNTEEHLWWRDGDFDPPVTSPNGEDIYWSRGNGWVYACLVRVLNIIPEDEPHRDEYISDFLEMTDALVERQREDGFWNCSLDDPNHFGGKETSGTAFFVYGMAWGINTGLLDSAKYMPIVVKAWEAMVKDALHPNGMLGWVQGTGKEPKDGQPVTYDRAANFEDYGLGAFLLAGSEVYKLAPEITK